MDGIQKIIARIEGDAQKEAEKIKAGAALKCAELQAEYEAAAQEEYKKRIQNGVKDCEIHVGRMASTAAMEAKKSVLSLKQEMVAKAFARSKELLRSMPEAEYVALLARFAATAARTGEEEIIVNGADSGKLAAKVLKAANERLSSTEIPANLSLSKESREIFGGLILKQGDIEVNCSIETLTDKYRNEMASQVADAMFG